MKERSSSLNIGKEVLPELHQKLWLTPSTRMAAGGSLKEQNFIDCGWHTCFEIEHFYECIERTCHFEKCVVLLAVSSFTTTLRDKNINNVPKFYLSGKRAGSEICIFHSIHPTGSFSRVRKKEGNPHTPTNTSFEQKIPMSQGLVTSEASVLSI